MTPNRFKARLARQERLIGCWAGLVSPYAAELVGHCGFDWVLLDGEHAPNDLPTLVAQMQVLDPLPPDVLVRLPVAEPWLLKMALDAGLRTLMIPMVSSVEEAEAVVRMVRYPPRGIRGVGHAMGRTSRFGLDIAPLAEADDEVCLIVQIESRAGVEALEGIMAVDGVDAIFIGPADLAADMGLPMNAPEVTGAIDTALRQAAKAGTPAGIIALDDDELDQHLASGAQFIAVAVDVLTLSQGLAARARHWTHRIQANRNTSS